MKFKAFVFDIIEIKSSNTKVIKNVGLFLSVLGLTIHFIDSRYVPLFKSNFFSSMFMLIGIVLYGFARFYQYFDSEKIESEKNGFIEFNEEGIILNYNEEVQFDQITEIKFFINGYYDERINLIDSTYVPTETKSSGILNEMQIKYRQQSKTLNFKLENESHHKVLDNNLFEIITNDQLKNVKINSLINLVDKRFKKSEKFVKYIDKLINEGRIERKYGLSLVGCKNIKDMRELLQKYSG